MVRSMYSGVAGMKSHQTKMDTIGNNIANVNTYGFKSSRVSFRDVYYQNMRSASAGTGNRGGTNPTQIGYGAMLGSISVNQGTSTMQNTGNALDVAIAGEGFFQVQDPDGNIYYTKAGMLDVDSAGNLVDVNGNFVLGVSGSPVGKPAGSNRIQFSIPSVNPSTASYEETINSIMVKVTTSKTTSDGNVTMNFSSSEELPIGQRVKAVITSSGVNITLNAREKFASVADLNSAINAAITEANSGEQHPAGIFNISIDPDSKFGSDGLTGAQIAGTNFGIDKGTVSVPTAMQNIITVSEVGDGFAGSGATTYKIIPDGTPATKYKFEITVGADTYTNEVGVGSMATAGSVLLTGPGGSTDTITITYPSEATLSAWLVANPTASTSGMNAPNDATASEPSRDLGLGSAPFKLTGGTEGGAQGVSDLTGIAIGSDGVVSATHPVHGLIELGRVDIATFANPKGLEQAGNTYFTVSANSGAATLAKPGEDGTGALSSGSLEMSNVDLSNEFADMITTQRGFQANSRLITVSDTMLEELINLKR